MKRKIIVLAALILTINMLPSDNKSSSSDISNKVLCEWAQTDRVDKQIKVIYYILDNPPDIKKKKHRYKITDNAMIKSDTFFKNAREQKLTLLSHLDPAESALLKALQRTYLDSQQSQSIDESKADSKS